jgi:hypothetical protein
MGETVSGYNIYVGNPNRKRLRYEGVRPSTVKVRTELNGKLTSCHVYCNSSGLSSSHKCVGLFPFYCGSCSIHEPSDCERGARIVVGWRRLQASWRLRARRPDGEVQSRHISIPRVCRVDVASLNNHDTKLRQNVRWFFARFFSPPQLRNFFFLLLWWSLSRPGNASVRNSGSAGTGGAESPRPLYILMT